MKRRRLHHRNRLPRRGIIPSTTRGISAQRSNRVTSTRERQQQRARGKEDVPKGFTHDGGSPVE